MAATAPAPNRRKKAWSRNQKIGAVAALAAVAALLFEAGGWYEAHKTTKLSEAQYSDSQLDGRIDGRINASTKLDTIISKLDDVSARLSKLEGWKDGVESRVHGLQKEQGILKQRVTGQEAINRISDPNRVLAMIRAEIELAHQSGRVLHHTQMVDYRTTVKALPTSAHAYWETVAAIINY